VNRPAKSNGQVAGNRQLAVMYIVAAFEVNCAVLFPDAYTICVGLLVPYVSTNAVQHRLSSVSPQINAVGWLRRKGFIEVVSVKSRMLYKHKAGRIIVLSIQASAAYGDLS
jgi:hypothetical protein